MKPSISKKTQSFLKSLEKKDGNEIVNYYGDLDEIDTLIYDKGLRIKDIVLYKDIDLMIIVLNNKKIMQRSISEFKLLKGAPKKQLNNYENDGTGIHWPDLDEDLSLKGFLKHVAINSLQKISSLER